MGSYYIRDGAARILSSCHLPDLTIRCSVYPMRSRLRLAHGGYLEQRQAHYRRSCPLYPWNHRYAKGLSQSTFRAHLEPSIVAAAGFALPTRLGANILPGESNEQLGKLDLIMTGPSLATNLLSTTLIACKAWCALLASNPQRLSLTMSLV